MKRKILTLCLLCLVSALPVFAGQVPGTSVILTPPEGFTPSDRIPGFVKKSTQSSIMITEIPGPFDAATAGFSDPELLQKKGLKLLSKSSVKVDGRRAMLLNVEQSAYGLVFQKWITIVDLEGTSTFIIATFPKDKAEEQEQSLKTAILSATFGKAANPTDSLLFKVEEVAPFKAAKVYGQNVILTPQGQFPVKTENTPFMVLGLSITEDFSVEDKLDFAENRMLQTPKAKDIEITRSTPVKIGDLAGFTTLAKALKIKSGLAINIYQVMLFDASGYSLMQGVTPQADASTYIPIFETIAKSFRLKKS